MPDPFATMKTITRKPRAKLKRSIRLRRKANAAIAQPVIRPWAKKSALSLLNALSSVPVKKLSQPVGKK